MTTLKAIFESYVKQYKIENPFTTKHKKSNDYRIETNILFQLKINNI